MSNVVQRSDEKVVFKRAAIEMLCKENECFANFDFIFCYFFFHTNKRKSRSSMLKSDKRNTQLSLFLGDRKKEVAEKYVWCAFVKMKSFRMKKTMDKYSKLQLFVEKSSFNTKE